MMQAPKPSIPGNHASLYLSCFPRDLTRSKNLELMAIPTPILPSPRHLAMHSLSRGRSVGSQTSELTLWEKFDSSGNDKGYHMAFGDKKRMKVYPMSSSITGSGKEEWFCPVDKRYFPGKERWDGPCPQNYNYRFKDGRKRDGYSTITDLDTHAKHHATDEISVNVYESSLNSSDQPSNEQLPSPESSTESRRASIASPTHFRSSSADALFNGAATSIGSASALGLSREVRLAGAPTSVYSR